MLGRGGRPGAFALDVSEGGSGLAPFSQDAFIRVDVTGSFTKADDAQLMRCIAAGDVQAYRHVVDGHLTSVLAYGFRLLNSREEAEEVAQETFLRVWQHADRYEPTARLTTWLHTIARNVALDRLRKRRPEVDTEAVEAALDSGRPSEYLERKRTAENVQQAVERLAPRQKQALVLVHYQGLSHGEAAEVLGVGVEAVESLLGRARRKLRESLRASAPESEKE
jgi:RNA polymerase sigma-70 factor, ECF subfamily